MDLSFRAKPWLYGSLLSFGVAIAIGIMLAVVISIPDRWDRATVIKVCRDGTKIFRMDDGEYRVRAPGSLRSFHANDANVCR